MGEEMGRGRDQELGSRGGEALPHLAKGVPVASGEGGSRCVHLPGLAGSPTAAAP